MSWKTAIIILLTIVTLGSEIQNIIRVSQGRESKSIFYISIGKEINK